MEKFFAGQYLYGDDFSLQEIGNWYKEEAEGYANLGSKNLSDYKYIYHELNYVHGFSKIESFSTFNNVLGIGSAYGYEFEPILSKIKNLTILEPSDNLKSRNLGKIHPKYVKPEVDGHLNFEDNSFDLITCFGTLHHIPNVSFVMQEMVRVSKPGGLILIREPIKSLGDWRTSRRGLTKNERGIPVKVFKDIMAGLPVKILHKSYCFTTPSLLQRLLKPLLNKPLFTYHSYIMFDKYLSKALAFNINYHSKSIWQKCSPSNIFYVLEKGV